MCRRSHGTYYFIAAGCHLAVGDKDKAQAMMDVILELIDKKKISGKDLPTEVYIKKKCQDLSRFSISYQLTFLLLFSDILQG